MSNRPLSRRQNQVLDQAGRLDQTVKGSADNLGISKSTVKGHIAKMKIKTGHVRSMAGAVYRREHRG